jgi:hypothetical protein
MKVRSKASFIENDISIRGYFQFQFIAIKVTIRGEKLKNIIILQTICLFFMMTDRIVYSFTILSFNNIFLNMQRDRAAEIRNRYISSDLVVRKTRS